MAALAAAVLVAAATAAHADRIRTAKGIGYDGQIVGTGPDSLLIQLNEVKRPVPLADVTRVECDKYPDLARAEDLYAQGVQGKAAAFAEAEKIYRLLLRESAPAWLRVLIQFRMYKLYAESGRATEALDAFLDMARNTPKLAEGLKLPPPAEDAHDVNKAMLAKVDEALRTAGDKPYAVELKSFRMSLVMLEGRPEEALPLLEPLLASTDPRTRQFAMLKQLELLLATGKAGEAADRFDQVASALGEEHVDEVAYWHGRILQEQGKPTDAALAYMAVPILYPQKDRNRTADALWRAGQSLEAAKAPAEAVTVYKEAAAKYAGTAGAERAKRELIRLGAK